MLKHWRFGFLPSVYEGILWPLISANTGEIIQAAAVPRSISTASYQVTTENYHSRSSLLTAHTAAVPQPKGLIPPASNTLSLPFEFVQQLVYPAILPSTNDEPDGQLHPRHSHATSQKLPTQLSSLPSAPRAVQQPAASLQIQQRPVRVQELNDMAPEEVCYLLEQLAAATSPHKKAWLAATEASLLQHHLAHMSFSQIARTFSSLSILRHPLSWDIVHTTQRLLAADHGALLSHADLPSATVLLSALLSLHCRSTFLRDLVLYTYVHLLQQHAHDDLPPPTAHLALPEASFRAQDIQAGSSSLGLHQKSDVNTRAEGSGALGSHAAGSGAAGSGALGSDLWQLGRADGSTDRSEDMIAGRRERAGSWAAQCVEAAGRKFLSEEGVVASESVELLQEHHRCEEKKDPFLLSKLQQLSSEKLLYMMGLLEGIHSRAPTMKRAPFHYVLRHVASSLVPHTGHLTCQQRLAVLATCTEVQYKPWELLNTIGIALHPDKVAGSATPAQWAAAAGNVARMKAHRREASTILLNIAFTASLNARAYTSQQLAAIVSAFGSVRPALRYHRPLFTAAVHRVDASQLSDAQLVGFVHGLVMSGFVHEAAYAQLLAEVRGRVSRLNVGGTALMLEAALALQSRGVAEASVGRFLQALHSSTPHLPQMSVVVLCRAAVAMARTPAWNDSLDAAAVTFLDDVADRLLEEVQQCLAEREADRQIRRVMKQREEVGERDVLLA